MSWEKVPLGTIADTSLGKMLDAQKNKGEFQPYLANVNVRWGSFDLDDLPLMRFEPNEEEKYGLSYGDLVMCEGGEPGRCALWKNQLPDMKIQKALHRVRAHADIDIRYLYYWFLHAGRRGILDQYFTGSTIKHMPEEKLKEVVIDKPPLPIQRRIADILSAYDDLIENNQRQIKLFEEAAMRLYREWFVFMRFPGHESVRIEDGVPEGWERVTVADCLSMSINGGWGKENPERSYQIPGKVIRGTDINDVKSGIVFSIPSRFHTEKDVISRRLSKWDIVFELSNGNIDNIGRTLLVDSYVLDVGGENLICASFCKLLRPLSPEIAIQLYLQINEMQENGLLSVYKKNGSNGINNFDFDNFLSHDFVVTNNTSYITPIMTIMDKITNLRKELVLLIKSRDALLPRLMNGGEGLKLEGEAV